MKKSVLYQNINVFDSNSSAFITHDLFVDSEGVVHLSPKYIPQNTPIIPASHLHAFVALTDVQVHFRTPGQEHKEDLTTGSLSAAKGGITRVLCMPNTKPVLDNAKVIQDAYEKAKAVDLIEIYFTGSITKNLDGLELSPLDELALANVKAYTDDGKGVMSDKLMKEAFHYSAKHNIPIVDHAEDLTTHNEGVMNEGVISKKYHLNGIPNRSESLHVERGCEYALETKGHYHVLHLSAKESLELVKKYKAMGARVTAEVSPHHLLLCDEDIKEVRPHELDANFKMNPPIRSRADREALVQGLVDGSIDIIATDHAPHTLEEKSRHFKEAPFGVVGVETAFPLIYTNFVKTKKISWQRLNELMNINPSKLINIKPTEIKNGDSANFFVVDLNSSYKIEAKNLISKSKNTPFEGFEVFGKVLATYSQGKLVFSL